MEGSTSDLEAYLKIGDDWMVKVMKILSFNLKTLTRKTNGTWKWIDL